jgi:TrmH family RNA methyltransferase
MKTISSESNAAFRLACRLKERRYREREGRFLIEGAHLLSESVSCGMRISHILLRGEGALARLPKEETASAECLFLTERLFDRLADTVTPQGVIAIVEKPVYGWADFAAGNVVVLDRIQDPGNVGSILRSADAAGFSGAIAVKGSADVYSGKVLRAAAGAVFRVPAYQAADGRTALAMLASAGIRPVACDMSGESLYTEADLSGRIAVIAGNEGGGLSDSLREGADLRVRIPMREGSESLNAAVAAAILMFEKSRRA